VNNNETVSTLPNTPQPENTRHELISDTLTDIVRRDQLRSASILNRPKVSLLSPGEQLYEPPAETRYEQIESQTPIVNKEFALELTNPRSRSVSVDKVRTLNAPASHTHHFEEHRVSKYEPECKFEEGSKYMSSVYADPDTDLKVGIASQRKLNMAAQVEAPLADKNKSAGPLSVADLTSLYENAELKSVPNDELLTQKSYSKLKLKNYCAPRVCTPEGSVDQCVELRLADQSSALESCPLLATPVEQVQLETKVRVDKIPARAKSICNQSEENCDKFQTEEVDTQNATIQKEPDSLLNEIQAMRQRILGRSVLNACDELVSAQPLPQPTVVKSTAHLSQVEDSHLIPCLDRVQNLRPTNMAKRLRTSEKFEHTVNELVHETQVENSVVSQQKPIELETKHEAYQPVLLNRSRNEHIPQSFREKTELIKSHDIEMQKVKISSEAENLELVETVKPKILSKEVRTVLKENFNEKIEIIPSEITTPVVANTAIEKGTVKKLKTSSNQPVIRSREVQTELKDKFSKAKVVDNFTKDEPQSVKVSQEVTKLEKITLPATKPLIISKEKQSSLTEEVSKTEAISKASLEATTQKARINQELNELVKLKTWGEKPLIISKEVVNQVEKECKERVKNIESERPAEMARAELKSETNSLIPSDFIDSKLAFWLNCPEINVTTANDQQTINLDEKLDLLYESICVKRQSAQLSLSPNDMVHVEKVLSLLLPNYEEVDFKNEHVGYIPTHFYEPVEHLKPHREPDIFNMERCMRPIVEEPPVTLEHTGGGVEIKIEREREPPKMTITNELHMYEEVEETVETTTTVTTQVENFIDDVKIEIDYEPETASLSSPCKPVVYEAVKVFTAASPKSVRSPTSPISSIVSPCHQNCHRRKVHERHLYDLNEMLAQHYMDQIEKSQSNDEQDSEAEHRRYYADLARTRSFVNSQVPCFDSGRNLAPVEFEIHFSSSRSDSMSNFDGAMGGAGKVTKYQIEMLS
jgi:hypothetical protein